MLEMKNTVSLIKNDFDRHISKFNTAKERINELEDMSVKIT